MAPPDGYAPTGRSDWMPRRSLSAPGAGSEGYYSADVSAKVVNVYIGRHRVSGDPGTMLVTTLGSCVAACIVDPVARIGGMNHFLLPSAPGRNMDALGPATRYGSVAMERLINDLLKAGGRRECLEVKLFGGARVIDSVLDVGVTNAAFAIDYVNREGLKLVVQDLGGLLPRRVNFFPATGRVLRRLLRREDISSTATREMRFLTRLQRVRVEGKVELFES